MHQPAPDPRTHHALARLGLALPLLAVAGLVFGKQSPPAEQTPEPPTEAPGQQDTSAPAEWTAEDDTQPGIDTGEE